MGQKESDSKVPKYSLILLWNSDKVLRTAPGDPLALVGGTLGPPVQGELQGASHFASPSRVAELEGQIKNLSEEQTRAAGADREEGKTGAAQREAG